ncbi:MAG: DUF4350 domain-containing protein [Drouetiella hepatica Uher 2000/2452]|jgi:hypothetical protein|uniref:DUF4350 domain-containing protein n=1 Tax=Drouetiella hepatica Uher 2000/2452 TaxID=904376 RepID=A0A951UQ39_9CYAN|nr:DUF4350 domain-containing protein [Drouetiella hepatica Uher 2000/2452]
MNFKNRRWLGAIALLTLILLSLFAAPATDLRQGSTYSRSPDGYGAWFAYMQAQGKPIQRWQKSVDRLFEADEPPVPSATEVSTKASLSSAPPSPITLIQIDNGNIWSTAANPGWIEQGNVLVLLGTKAPVSKAPFRSSLSSPSGSVKIETSQRYTPSGQRASEPPGQDSSQIQPILRDDYGAVVWEEAIGKGRIIHSSTPFLAANAYQDEPGNFKFLAKLVIDSGHPIWVDEYIHGYRDPDPIAPGKSPSLLGYLAQTPLLIVGVQALVLLLTLIWGQNRRLGAPKKLAEPPEDNSTAYIQALAGVLQKANSSDFVAGTIAKAEQIQFQRSLGLGTALLDSQTVSAAWHQQTGQPAAQLQEILDLPQGDRRSTDSELLTWLKNIQTAHQQLER